MINSMNQFEKSALFDQLEPVERDALMQKFQRHTYSAGDIVFHENEPGDALYIVEAGSVSIQTRITGEIQKTLFTAEAGGVFGEFSFMDGGSRSASAAVTKSAELLSLKRAHFDAFIERQPAAGIKILDNLLTMVVSRLRQTNHAYREAVRWALELTGTQSLNFHYLITENATVTLELISNRTVSGKVVQLERSEAGFQVILMQASGSLVIVPYHAVAAVTAAP